MQAVTDVLPKTTDLIFKALKTFIKRVKIQSNLHKKALQISKRT